MCVCVCVCVCVYRMTSKSTEKKKEKKQTVKNANFSSVSIKIQRILLKADKPSNSSIILSNKEKQTLRKYKQWVKIG